MKPPPLCSLIFLVLCFFLNSSSSSSERMKYTVKNLGKSDALIRCKGRDHIVDTFISYGAIFSGEAPRKFKNSSVICELWAGDRLQETSVTIYFVAFLEKHCKKKCDWRVYEDGKLELNVGSKWRVFRSWKNPEEAKMYSSCGDDDRTTGSIAEPSGDHYLPKSSVPIKKAEEIDDDPPPKKQQADDKNGDKQTTSKSDAPTPIKNQATPPLKEGGGNQPPASSPKKQQTSEDDDFTKGMNDYFMKKQEDYFMSSNVPIKEEAPPPRESDEAVEGDDDQTGGGGKAAHKGFASIPPTTSGKSESKASLAPLSKASGKPTQQNPILEHAPPPQKGTVKTVSSAPSPSIKGKNQSNPDQKQARAPEKPEASGQPSMKGKASPPPMENTVKVKGAPPPSSNKGDSLQKIEAKPAQNDPVFYTCIKND